MIGNGRQCDVPVTLSASHRLQQITGTARDESL